MTDRLEGNETGYACLRQVANWCNFLETLKGGGTEGTSGEDGEVAGELPSLHVQYEKTRKNVLCCMHSRSYNVWVCVVVLNVLQNSLKVAQ